MNVRTEQGIEVSSLPSVQEESTIVRLGGSWNDEGEIFENTNVTRVDLLGPI